MTKYYTSTLLSAGFAGMARIAMRKYTIPSSMAVEYLLGDHLGSTSITTNTNGAKVSEIRYKPCPLHYVSGMLREGEIRYSWTSNPSTTPAYKLTSYTFTGQFSYMDDPTTAGVTEGFGLMFYNARMYDPALGRFTSADTIVPGGVQGLDRYAYANNSPVMYIDPSGHTTLCGATCEEAFEQPQYSLDDMADMYGVTFSPDWALMDQVAALVAVYKVAKTLQKEFNSSAQTTYQSCLENLSGPGATCSQPVSVTPAEAFKKVYRRGVELIWGCSDCKKLAITLGKDTVRFRDFYRMGNTMLKNTSLVIHELGHMFNNLFTYEAGGKWFGPSLALTTNLADNRNGMGAPYLYQQSDDISPSEIFADMFVHWIQGGWARNDDGTLTDDAIQRINWLNQHMLKFIP